jgi:hypothetical protein
MNDMHSLKVVLGFKNDFSMGFVMAGNFMITIVTLSKVDGPIVVHKSDIVDDLEGDRFDDLDTETNQRSMARTLSILESSSNNRQTITVHL